MTACVILQNMIIKDERDLYLKFFYGVRLLAGDACPLCPLCNFRVMGSVLFIVNVVAIKGQGFEIYSCFLFEAG